MKYNLCEDNVMCCDDNCQACAQRIYERYMEEKQLKKHKKIKCHVMTMYDWLKKNHPESFYTNGKPIYCPFATFFGLVYDCRDNLCNKLSVKDFDNEMCIKCWQRPFRGIKNDKR